jgi:hypothetical protein
MELNIIKGERIQQLCDIYIGLQEDFNYNPLIKLQTNKHKDINTIIDIYNNPTIIFCYSHRIELFVKKMKYLKNEFILVTHNSDQNIEDTNVTNEILSCQKLKKWYSQNVCFKNEKLISLPIGLANNMWAHGDLTYFINLGFENILNLHLNKSNKIYFNFNINTNINKRKICYNSLISKIPFLNNLSTFNNLNRLSKYEFCICPEGNGVDTHRLWEAIYLQSIPIVLKTPFIEIIKQEYNLNMVILNSWDELDISKLNYSKYIFDESYFDNILLYSKNFLN